MNKYSNASNHIDKSVIYVFLAAFFVSISVFAYRYTKYTPCEDVSFKINTIDYTIGALIKFEDLTNNSKYREWDFGDNSITSNQKQPFHAYKEPGDYKVKLLVNNICDYTETITILAKKEILDPTKFPVFKIPKTIKVGQKLKVIDETENASTWEWTFGETAKINAITKNATYIYKEPGFKTISLVVNGDLRYISKEIIEVLPLEVVKNDILDIPQMPSKPAWEIKYEPDAKLDIKDQPSAPKLAPYINESDFSKKLLLVAKEELSAKAFSEYFCGDINKSVVVNGKNSTFLLFCKKISGKRRTKIKKIEIFRDKGSNCIKTVTIDCRIPGLFND